MNRVGLCCGNTVYYQCTISRWDVLERLSSERRLRRSSKTTLFASLRMFRMVLFDRGEFLLQRKSSINASTTPLTSLAFNFPVEDHSPEFLSGRRGGAPGIRRETHRSLFVCLSAFTGSSAKHPPRGAGTVTAQIHCAADFAGLTGRSDSLAACLLRRRT